MEGTKGSGMRQGDRNSSSGPHPGTNCMWPLHHWGISVLFWSNENPLQKSVIWLPGRLGTWRPWGPRDQGEEEGKEDHTGDQQWLAWCLWPRTQKKRFRAGSVLLPP